VNPTCGIEDWDFRVDHVVELVGRAAHQEGAKIAASWAEMLMTVSLHSL